MSNANLRILSYDGEIRINKLDYEQTVPATFIESADGGVIKYEEFDIENGNKTDVTISFNCEEVNIKKAGMQKTDIIVKNTDYIHDTCYETPYGIIPMRVTSLFYKMSFADNRYNIWVRYNLKSEDSIIGDFKLLLELTIK